MAAIARSTVSIRFFGEALIPAELTAALGAESSTQYMKGDARTTKSGQTYVRKHGAWILAASVRMPEAIDAQLSELFGQLTQEMSVWLMLTTRFDADVFCGIFMKESNEGFSLLPGTLRALADRNLEIGFEIYDPVDDEPNIASAEPGEA
jgi:hypothetical protein